MVATMTEAKRYPAQVFWSDEDEGFVALATDLPGCSAFGETQEEAVKELQGAIVASIEALQAAGNPVPKPSRPADANQYSGKVLVRMPKFLHAQLAASAQTEDVSLNQYIVARLAQNHTARTLEVHSGAVSAIVSRGYGHSSAGVGIGSALYLDRIFDVSTAGPMTVVSCDDQPHHSATFVGNWNLQPQSEDTWLQGAISMQTARAVVSTMKKQG